MGYVKVADGCPRHGHGYIQYRHEVDDPGGLEAVNAGGNGIYRDRLSYRRPFHRQAGYRVLCPHYGCRWWRKATAEEITEYEKGLSATQEAHHG